MSTNNRMFLLLINNVRVLVIFKRIIVTICKKDKKLEYIFLEIIIHKLVCVLINIKHIVYIPLYRNHYYNNRILVYIIPLFHSHYLKYILVVEITVPIIRIVWEHLEHLENLKAKIITITLNTLIFILFLIKIWYIK